ncbi:MAG TPA: glycosyltransferase [Syntrophobacteraceae bacterium]|nr:glycosyltransferase [Syntrophobacteraceae bacterium]
MSLTIVSAVNDEAILKSCLLQSPDLRSGVDLILQTGFSSAAEAYNDGIRKCKGDIIVFVHQDVYLPEGWVKRLKSAIGVLNDSDPNWGVLGVWGVQENGKYAGHVYWQQAAGQHFHGGIEVVTLDELVLIVRASSGLSFDEALAGFHMYGADICLEATQRGMRCYAISAFCIHNAGGYRMLPLQFWRAYFFMRKKWRYRLPVKTTCTEITTSCWPMIRWNIIRAAHLAVGQEMAHQRIADPGLLYRELVNRQIVLPCQD